MRCRSCNNEVSVAAGERVGFRDSCAHCGEDLHSCSHCVHHDPSAYNECRESQAERVGDRERANRCEWFGPGEGGANGEQAAGAKLDALKALFEK